MLSIDYRTPSSGLAPRPPFSRALQALVGTLAFAHLTLGHAQDDTGGGFGAAVDEAGAILVDGLTLALLAAGAVAFVLVVVGALSKYGEVRRGRADAADLAGYVIVGAVLLVFIGFLITSGTDAIGEIPGGGSEG